MVMLLLGTQVVPQLLSSSLLDNIREREREFGCLIQGVMLCCNARLHVIMNGWVNGWMDGWMDKCFVRVFMDKDGTCCDLVDQL